MQEKKKGKMTKGIQENHHGSCPKNQVVMTTQQINLCKTINQLKQIHTHLLKTLTKPQQRGILPTLLTHLLQLPGKNLLYARYVFDQIPNCKIQFLWTSLIRYHVQHGDFRQSITLFSEMQRMGVAPSGFTFSSLLNACARVPAILEGRQVHKGVMQLGFFCNKVVQTSLLDMYAKCGCVEDAKRVFDAMDDKDVVAWTAMISGYTKVGVMDEARCLFDSMGEHNVVSWTTMVAGYANCGDMNSAREFYDKMMEKNSVTWIAMIAGYGKCGDVSEARRVFDAIPEPDESCWATMLTSYSLNGYAKEAIEMYKAMREENIEVTDVAMVGAISACAQLGDNELAKTLVQHIEESYPRTLFISNSLIHMHAKCGCMEEAWREFNRMKERDAVSYTTMITALADHGKFEEALDVFSKMQKEGIKPSQVTFTAILTACSRGGLVEEGCKQFELMTHALSIEPSTEHITCMVDLLGRGGQLERAYNLILQYRSVVSDEGIWCAFQGACKIHGNVEMAERAARHLSETSPKDAANYVVLANTYATTKQWDDAERVRKLITERGMRKSPGCSWISG